MASQYSILYVLIRPEIQEKISIGLLLMDDNNLYFEFSKNKLSISKTLLSDNAYKSLKDALANIQTTAENEHLKEKPLNFGFEKTNTFKKSYIDYLSRYNNNILSFTPLKEIELIATKDIFSKLYKKFIDSAIVSLKPQFVNIIEQFKVTQFDVLSKHFNIDKEITHKEVHNLIVPVTVTLIGQNEVPTFVQSLDMEKRTDFLIADISEILFLQKAFAQMNKKSIAMSITSEPDKIAFPKQHDIWIQLKNTKDIINYDISEAEAVIEYAEEHNVHPFLISVE